MRVLFVCSGNNRSVVVSNQAASLREAGVSVDLFRIVGKGTLGYLADVPRLRRVIGTGGYDVVHAHYSYSAYVATLAGARRLVVSLMGSDAEVRGWGRSLLRLLSRRFWDTTIVKSAAMRDQLDLPHVRVIPNGVSLQRFESIDRRIARDTVAFSPSERHVLFPADPARAQKDYPLADAAFQLVRDPRARLHVVHGEPHERMPFYMAAADALLLTSLYEGSANVIKEAMAAGLPIVATAVGDVPEIVGDTAGCAVVHDRDPRTVAEALERVLASGRRTNGRERIGWLDSGLIARKLIDVYQDAAGTTACRFATDARHNEANA